MKIKKLVLTSLVLAVCRVKPMDWKCIGRLIKSKLDDGASPEEIHNSLSKILPQRTESDTAFDLGSENNIALEDRPTKPLNTSTSQISNP